MSVKFFDSAQDKGMRYL